MATTHDQGIKLNGVAHVILTVADGRRSKPFYRLLCNFFGMTCVFDEDQQPELKETYLLYFVGGRTALGIAAADDVHKTTAFAQRRPGLHHVCFRARKQSDVDRFYEFATKELIPKAGGRIIHSPESGGWAPGYYSVLFEDPDGIRLELNFVPNKGLLALDRPRVQAKL